MNYALYQYINSVGTVSHALVDIKSKKVFKALPLTVTGVLIWNRRAVKSNSIWEAIQADKHHKIVAIASHPSFITPRS